jgi:hypothetical protein
VSGFLTRLAARGAGLRLADAPAALAARARSRFEPPAAFAPVPDAGFEASENIDAPAAIETAFFHQEQTSQQEQGSDPTGPTSIRGVRRVQPTSQTTQSGPAGRSDSAHADDSSGLARFRTGHPTSPTDDPMPEATDRPGDEAARHRSPALPNPGSLPPATSPSATGHEPQGPARDFDTNEPSRAESARAAPASRIDRPDQPDMDARPHAAPHDHVSVATAVVPSTRSSPASDRLGLPPPVTPASLEPDDREPHVSIGRIDVIFEDATPSAPQAPRRAPIERTRGFAGYERARRGIRR